MNEYIVKIDNNYYAGDKIYTIRGYMDKKHPSKTIKLTRYDFKALAVDDYEDAVKIKERCKKLGKKIEILKIKKSVTVDTVKYRILNGFANEVYDRIIYNVCVEFLKRGYKEVELYLTRRREIEYQKKREKGWL